jgi:DNA-binding response OmpR family regulator
VSAEDASIPSVTALLVVEDDPAVGALISTVLNEVPGWTATVVPEAAAAKAAFDQVRIAVLVLDVNLPGISGLDLLELLRNDPAWHDPVVILMSGNEHQPGVRRALEQGTVSTFLAKPLDLQVLVDTIAEQLAIGGHPDQN